VVITASATQTGSGIEQARADMQARQHRFSPARTIGTNKGHRRRPVFVLKEDRDWSRIAGISACVAAAGGFVLSSSRAVTYANLDACRVHDIYATRAICNPALSDVGASPGETCLDNAHETERPSVALRTGTIGRALGQRAGRKVGPGVATAASDRFPPPPSPAGSVRRADRLWMRRRRSFY